MSTVKFNPVIDSFSRAIGNLVFLAYDGVPYVKSKVIPANPNSPAQQEVRGAFAALGPVWRQLAAIMKAAWHAHSKKGKRRRMRGLATFMAANARKQRLGEPLVLCPGLGEEALSSFSAASGSVAGSIDCSFARAPSGEGKHITLFVHRKENGHANGELAKIALGANQQSPYTIANLDSGSQYFVYAVLTDKALEEAETVSASSSALTSAR